MSKNSRIFSLNKTKQLHREESKNENIIISQQLDTLLFMYFPAQCKHLNSEWAARRIYYSNQTTSRLQCWIVTIRNERKMNGLSKVSKNKSIKLFFKYEINSDLSISIGYLIRNNQRCDWERPTKLYVTISGFISNLSEVQNLDDVLVPLCSTFTRDSLE